MENEIQSSIPPVQPMPQTPVPPQTNWSKILLFILLGLVVIGGSVIAGIQIGKSQTSSQQQPIVVLPTVPPTQMAVIPTALATIPNPTINPTADWKTYTNQKLGITLQYPLNLFFKEIDPNYGAILAFEPFPDPQIQGSYVDSIKITSDAYASFEFNALQKTPDGNSITGYDLHKVCGVIVTKLKNTKFGEFDGVEYIFDGSNPPNGCGRDLIGYEHTILIRKNDSLFIKIINGSMKKENTEKHQIIFDQILSTFKFTN